MKQRVVIVGAGMIGLTVARTCARLGMQVTVLDRGDVRDSASWTAPGILPYRELSKAQSAHSRLIGLSADAHARLSQELREETGIDDEYTRNGEVEAAYTDAAAQKLDVRMAEYAREGVICEPIFADFLGAGCTYMAKPVRAYFLPQTATFRPPRRLRALEGACAAHGVQIQRGVHVVGILLEAGRAIGVESSAGPFHADRVVLASGAWAGLINLVGRRLPVTPIRGQIALLKTSVRMDRMVSVSSEYLVPRRDGLVLAGSTMEDVGFDVSTTTVGIETLLRHARETVPMLGSASVQATWSGLRPATPDGNPLIGFHPEAEGLVLAVGHQRLGLQMSTGTAQLVAELLQHKEPSLPLAAFDPKRFTSAR